ncbi:lipase [Nocardia sp. CDC159]|uniref:Lipase n=1 Tax=Nocardia pulmonis TaxID=2951408 RepID=A0A9X2EAZ1_9NOCA|nr:MULTISPECIES: lipase family protein [Nocardia]MCM6774793.1 lipase [Nocardia pulmonis]MCM6789724.1 lipase [Nocardia sp. CDC159]
MLRKLWIAAALTLTSATGLLGLPAAQAGPAAGTVQSVEPLPAAATLPGSVHSERILYSTTTVGDRPTVASAAVYFPPGAPPAGGWPIIAWAHGTVGLADDCAYSLGGPAEVDRDWAYLGTWLRQGYAIVAADYAGLGTPGEHPYLNGVVEAHNVVDAVRAASGHYGTLSKKWVVVGQSQGGGAAVTTARYATEFGGAELDYRGAVGTGVPAYIEDILVPLGPGVPPVKLGANSTAYVLFILNGLRTTYPELDIDSFLTEAGRHWTERARQVCAEPLIEELAAHNVVGGDLFARPLAQIPDLHGLLHRYLGLPESGYDKPLFLGQGLRDTDVITPETLRFAAVLQLNRQPVTVRVYPTDHSGAVNASLADSVPFVRNLFA